MPRASGHDCLRMPCTGCAGERGPASHGRDNESLAVAPLPREYYIPVMVVHPDETIIMACKLAASPKQPKSEGVCQRSFAWFPSRAVHWQECEQPVSQNHAAMSDSAFCC